jgi:hypothetical protein
MSSIDFYKKARGGRDLCFLVRLRRILSFWSSKKKRTLLKNQFSNQRADAGSVPIAIGTA